MIERTGYLRCKVARGYFASELYVMVSTQTLGSSVYVDSSKVRTATQAPASGSIDGEVFVYILEEGETDVLIELPGEAVVGGLRTRVPKNALVP